MKKVLAWALILLMLPLGGFALAVEANDVSASTPTPELSAAKLNSAPPLTAGRKFLNQWSFLDAYDETMTQEASISFADLESWSKDEVIQKIKDTILPKKLRGWSADGDDKNVFGTFGFNTNVAQTTPMNVTDENGTREYGSGAHWGVMPISNYWQAPADAAAPFHDEQKLVFFVDIPVTQNSDGVDCRIYVNSNEEQDHKNGLGNTNVNPQLLSFTVTLKDLDLTDHTVHAANPSNVTVNLFDYWVQDYGKTPTALQSDMLPKSDSHIHETNDPGVLSQSPSPYSTEGDWNAGINRGHLLLFGDGMIHAGLWNKGAGENCQYGKDYAGMEDIVKNTLDDSGYPEVNLTNAEKLLNDDRATAEEKGIYRLVRDYALTGDHDAAQNQKYTSLDVQNLSKTVLRTWGQDIKTGKESLQYLFDPDPKFDTYRTTYENVTGLFQLNDEGYYYYDMRRNFAEFKEEQTESSDGRFILYDAPATMRTDSKKSIGNFFPFNTGREVFNGLQTDQNRKERLNSVGVACSGNTMNHHLGMTVNVDFRQPANGMISTGKGQEPMSFGFSGDDDVWVFIDDVLVLDMGGIHSEIYGTIDFATGDVYIGRAFDTHGVPDDPDNPDNMVTHTTLKELYKEAGREDAAQWTESTFASNTSHTLKMFYLERGNYDSSIALRFNLQPLLYQQIKKVDQNGNPLKGVGFDLYPAQICNAKDQGSIQCLYTDSETNADNETFYVQPQPDEPKLLSLTTGQNGIALFRQGDGYFNFADRGDQYYILRETNTPRGYRGQPEDIVLHYNAKTAELSVANRWSTGAYACSVANITAGGSIGIDEEEQKDGLAIAVPLLQKKDGTWLALCGSNLSKFDSPAAPFDQSDTDAVKEAVLQAMLHQAADKENAQWFLDWDDGNNRLYGQLNDLPGLATRYKLNNPEKGDLHMVYGVISKDAFNTLIPNVTDSNGDGLITHVDRYAALREYLQTDGNIQKALNALDGNLQLIEPTSFNRSLRSMVYIPNERRELRVLKIDQDGNPLSGAVFALYSDQEATNQVASGRTDKNGSLVFSPTGNGNGQAQMEWGAAGTTYYLKEKTAPSGHTLNSTTTPVVVGNYSIYADAGTKGDGVSVMAGSGRLTQTMRQCAVDNKVDVTLQDITATMQTQPSNNFALNDWKDAVLEGTGTVVSRCMNLHFGLNTEVDYGLHDEDGGRIFKPYFITDEGYVRVRIEQNYDALTGKEYGGAEEGVRFDDLGDTDLTNLFSLLNVVVVTDEEQTPSQTGQLTVRKIIEGKPDAEDALRLFHFRITFTGDKIHTDSEFSYYFYGEDKVGTIKNGGELWLHHDESVTILGLPAGVEYKVTELTEHDYIAVMTDETGAETDGTGTIRVNTESVVAFTNTKTRPNRPTDPSEPPTDPSEPPTDPSNPSTDPNRQPIPNADTGDRWNGSFWIVLCVLSALGMVAVYVSAFRKRRH